MSHKMDARIIGLIIYMGSKSSNAWALQQLFTVIRVLYMLYVL